MKNLLKLMSRVLMAVFLMLSLVLVSKAQTEILFRGFSVKLENTAKASKSDLSKEAPTNAGRRFWILQLSEPQTEVSLKSLEAKGLVIGQAIGKGCYLANSPAKFNLSENNGILGIAVYQPEFRLSPGLKTILTNSNKSSSISIHLLPHSGFSEILIKKFWKADWGIISEVWDGPVQRWTIQVTAEQLLALSLQNWVQWMEESEGELIPFNQKTSTNARATYVSAGLNGLNGSGVTVAVGDGGMVETHADLQSHQKNLTTNKIGAFGDHQDHVSGTLAGKGLLQADKKGVATGINLYNLQTSSVVSTGAALRQNYNVNLTNNSYGVNLNCPRAGNYSATSFFIDGQVNSLPDLLHVFAAGNQGGSACGGYPGGYNTIAEGYPVSKNVLTVGSISGNDQFAWFSSRGPVKDGRVKPEIVSNGNEIVSTVPFDSYGEKGGTSMAAPVLTGVLALLTQQYKILNGQQLPEVALLKGLVCNTAEDIGNENVDYSFGYGRVNARRARKAIQEQNFRSGTLVSNGLNQINISAPANAKGVKIMLSWLDPAGVVGAETALINDLDLNVVNGSGITFQPWVLNPDPIFVNQPAIRKMDLLNNLEQVTLPVSGNEVLHVKVSSKSISGLQKYWLVFEWQLPELILTSPIPGFFSNTSQSIEFQWDIAALSPTAMVVESSLDSLFGFTTFASVSNLISRLQAVLMPVSNFEKRYYRLKASGSFGTFYSNVTGVLVSNKPILSVNSCHETAQLNWNSIPEATKYELLKLDLEAGKWISKGFSTANSFIINHLENSIRHGFAVKPWFGNNPGHQSDGKIVTPAPGNCPWAGDLGISEILKPVSARLNTPGTVSQLPAQVVIMNYGNQAIGSQLIAVRYRLDQGQEFSSNHLISLQPGQSQTLVLPNVALTNLAGTFNFKVNLDFTQDQNPGNNELVQSFIQLPNPAISIPWAFNVESLAIQKQVENKFSISQADFLEFKTGNAGRFQATRFNPISSFGSKSIVLDKSNIDGKTSVSELIFHLNLSNYSNSDQLILDFDWLPLGNISSGNGLWVRASENSEWKEVKQFWQQVYSINQVMSFAGINLVNFLGSEVLSSSFQLKFTYSGQKPFDIPNGGGYAIDNLLLSIPEKDVVVRKLLGPETGCVGANVIRKVKIRLLNNSDSGLSQIAVGYQISDAFPVHAVVPFIPSNDSIDFTFEDTLSTDFVGKLTFKIWARSLTDNYPTNDTIRNLSVFISPKVSSFPYYEGFEANDGKWNAYGTKSSWEWGVPARNLSVIDTAANGSNIWVTNFSGNYNANELSYLESPCFDFSEMDEDFQFSFNAIHQLETDYDFAYLEVSEDGISWKKVGWKGSGTNWYNHDSEQWNGTSNQWSVRSNKLTATAFSDKKNIRFRFAFSSDISLSYEGIGIDDIHIEPVISIYNDSSFQQTVPKSGGGEWVHFSKGNELVAEVERRAELGGISLNMKKNMADLRFSEYTPYLDRNFFIKPDVQPTEPVKVRLFIKDEELKKLQLADPTLESFQQLGVYKYDGPNADIALGNNSQEFGNHEFIRSNQILKVPTAGGYFLEFQIASFSEFYIASQSLKGGEDPLPVKLISFLAKNSGVKGQVDLEWKTASEVNCDRFELSFSCDGKRFEKIKDFSPMGAQNLGYTYQFSHLPGNCFAENFIYKLSQFELGQFEPALEVKAICKNVNAGISKVNLVNPATGKLIVSGLSEGSQIQILDMLGRSVDSFVAENSDLQRDIKFLSQGNYIVKIKSVDHTESFRLIKN